MLIHLLLITALSLDTFIAAFSYGTEKMIQSKKRIPKKISFSCFKLNFILSVYVNYKEVDKDLSKSFSIKEA